MEGEKGNKREKGRAVERGKEGESEVRKGHKKEYMERDRMRKRYGRK